LHCIPRIEFLKAPQGDLDGDKWIIRWMKLRFTKMQGAGNDFVVLDATRAPLDLSSGQYRFLADRHFGVGADQILTVLPSPADGVDFEYKIHNADGGEVEQCGNGARCFFSYVHTHALSRKPSVKVQTMNRLLDLQSRPDGQVTVDMEAPRFELAQIPFHAAGLAPQASGPWQLWPLAFANDEQSAVVHVAIVSMGNPHAVMLVDDVDTARVADIGPRVQQHAAFPQGVNVGFMQVLGRARVRLRVYERGAGETLACGTGACAAVVCGIRLGLLDACVDVQTRGGLLTVEWAGDNAPVLMTGPATTVFEGEIDVPDVA
jgi:diaminopimelate epimerase